MKKEYQDIEALIKENLDSYETQEALDLMNELKDVKEKGFFTKKQFFDVCMWKTPRPKNLYLSNAEEKIIEISKQVLLTDNEQTKIELLKQLKGISIPTASTILTIIDPENYGIIDIRAWQVMNLYEEVEGKLHGNGFCFNDWHVYLTKLRALAKKFNVSVRDIERTLFFYHKKIQEGKLYV